MTVHSTGVEGRVWLEGGASVLDRSDLGCCRKTGSLFVHWVLSVDRRGALAPHTKSGDGKGCRYASATVLNTRTDIHTNIVFLEGVLRFLNKEQTLELGEGMQTSTTLL